MMDKHPTAITKSFIKLWVHINVHLGASKQQASGRWFQGKTSWKMLDKNPGHTVLCQFVSRPPYFTVKSNKLALLAAEIEAF